MTELIKLITNAMQEVKATEIQTCHVTSLTTITDYMIIGNGRSARQVKAIADKIIENTKQHGIKPLGVEGEQQSEWILIDFGDVIAHVMQPATRDYYQLEKLWEDGRDADAGSSQI
ncbi:MAG: ribosome silencing factor [Gammaproteobacteria bacterium]